ncbi:MAG: calcium-binding protein [Oscillatoriales cyanobacterium]|nr:MAG: calcium-binding protein [Oscillatoriales cyanobacterium]
MANYAIFDEKYYLAQYPWVKPAIDAGVIASGKEHFEKFGRAGGLTKVSRYFDEATYLAGNPDLAPFVKTVNPNAPFATGLDHFIQFGYDEGQRRTKVSPEYNEDFYLANNSELRSFIGANAPFKSGYQLKTGREHYFNFGKNEPSRDATFVGSRSNDIITGVGVGNTELVGVEVGIDRNGNRQYESFGTNEFDVLIGSPGVDTFVLGVPASAGNPSAAALYTGNGQATIRNFDIENDLIQLQGNSLSGYSLTPVGGNLSIQRFGDVLGVIEGGANLNLSFIQSNGNGTFAIG